MTAGERSARPLRLLLLEDDPRDAELVLDTLEQGGFACAAERVDGQEAFVRALEGSCPFDVILADYVLPGFDAVEALAIARRRRPGLPFILISGRVGEEAAIDMLHAGATDYVLKQRMGRLLPALTRALRERELETERQAAVRQLADVASRLEQKALLERVIAEVPVGIVVAQAPGGEILALNRRVESILGRERSELKTVADIARCDVYRSDGQRARLEDLPSHRTLTTGVPIRDLLLEFRRRDRQSVLAHVNTDVIRDPAGHMLAVVASYSEVTELRRAQAERDRLIETLREADRRKNEFLGMLSHELRNPLAPIRNSLYILGRTPPGGAQAARALAVIDRQVRHTTRLVDDLLDVTRISHGKVRLQRELVDLVDLARGAAEDHRDLFEKNGVLLALRLPEAPVVVDGDPTRIAQIIGNLLHNAVKFTARGGATTLGLERIDGFATVTVQDTGSGISPEVLAHLFEPFVQADSTLDRSTGGLGLGLALVKGLAELHGGTVLADSEGAGKGTTVTVRLPLERRGTSRASVAPSRPAPGGARRVLVIEDNIDAAETLKEALELNDHVVEIALNGSDGLDKVQSMQPDVVVCDIGLPGIDGFQVATRIRAHPEHGGVALIALSGYAGAEDVERSRQAGFDLHLAKPPAIDTLERAIVSARESAAARSTAPEAQSGSAQR
jgi:two-component system CheB/CheR fusion protein